MAYLTPFTLDKIQARLKEVGEAVVRRRAPLEFALGRSAPEGWQGRGFDARGWESIRAGSTFRALEETLSLRAVSRWPAEWRSLRPALALTLKRTPVMEGTLLSEESGYVESLIYVDGSPIQAADRYHRQIMLPSSVTDNEEHVLCAVPYVGFARMWVLRNLETENVPAMISVEVAELQGIDEAAYGLYYDMLVAIEAVRAIEPSSRLQSMLLSVLDEVTELLDFRSGRDDAFYASVGRAERFLREGLYERYGADANFSPFLWAIGHAHIDTAWLWRLEHTRKKCERTFTTAVHFLNEYEDYIFVCSQAQQYQFVKEDNPKLYARIKEAAAAGRWEPVGSMWVEADCNIPSGESLVRQFLYGARFFRQEFGKASRVGWLPDVFGYSASLPQIMRQAGCDYFATTKLSWSQINKPIYETFVWHGIDGSSVLTHFPPLGEYSSLFTAKDLSEAWSRYDQKHLSGSALYVYGHGDGGGGPSRDMLERAKRLKDFPGMPRLCFGHLEDFFRDLEDQVLKRLDLPHWVGELYLEVHRGTYTSQAWIKQANRRAENELLRSEQAAALAMLLGDAKYPSAQFDEAWKLVLCNQFHDIVTGSSIKQVYDDARRDYKRVFSLTKGISETAIRKISQLVRSEDGHVLVFNPLSWTRSDIVKCPDALPFCRQRVTNLDGTSSCLVRLPSVSGLGFRVLSEEPPLEGEPLTARSDFLENRFFRVRFDENGEIDSLFDKQRGREVLDRQCDWKGNSLLAFEDKPLKDDAWDIDIFYRQKLERVRRLDSMKVVEEGPLRAALEIKRSFGRGTALRQKICLYRDSRRIDFETLIDWRERQTLLKVAFPVTVVAPNATYDIQFGTIERPTHWNTPWDWARFEVYGHKWADLSEADYGVAVLNDSKYGWDIKDNVIRLTLLRAPVQPDPSADLGSHLFTYSLYPHEGDWRQAEVMQRAYELNMAPLFAPLTANRGTQTSFSLMAVDSPNVIIETVKRAEDEDALIVRMFEAYGQRGRARVRLGLPVRSITCLNLLEEGTGDSVEGNVSGSRTSLTLDYRPYEIKTLKLVLQRQ